MALAGGRVGAQGSSGRGRTALVVGNARYEAAALKNPVNDARLMGRTLKGLGYAVTLLEDAGLETMLQAFRTWTASATEAEARLFYFAGHGAQYRGRSFILPVDIELTVEEDLLTRAIHTGDLTDQLARLTRGVNIVVLDACRNAAFPLTTRNGRSRAVSGSLQEGLAATTAAQGTLIAYSTAPGSVAQDGKDGNSAYTRHLADQIATAGGAPIEQVFKRVRQAVARETANRQVPWESSSLVGDFCLAPTASGTCSAPPLPRGGAVDLGRL